MQQVRTSNQEKRKKTTLKIHALELENGKKKPKKKKKKELIIKEGVRMTYTEALLLKRGKTR